MKTEFKFKGIHSCEAVVLSCIDFRFWKETMEFVETELGITSYDFPSLPGGAKPINECASDDDLAMKCIGVPCDLHHVKKIVIVNHEDCGAYGGSKKFQSAEEELDFHTEELKRAKEKLAEKYPDLDIITVFARLADGGYNIEFLTIS